MPHDSLPNPYLNTWLKRTRKELSNSGKLSELVLILSKKGGSDENVWRGRLQRILDGEEPSFEILTEIDSQLSKPVAPGAGEGQGSELFAAEEEDCFFN